MRAHHEITLLPYGEIVVLTEAARRLSLGVRSRIVLDNSLCFISADGHVLREVSLLDALGRDQNMRRRVSQVVAAATDIGDVALRLFRNWERNEATETECLTSLRLLPGSSVDILHANGICRVPSRFRDRFRGSTLLVSLRQLDLVVGLDDDFRPVWSWGDGVISRQHQPSITNAGELMLLDNAPQRGASRVLKVDPRSGQIVWSYGEAITEKFFCPLAGGVEELEGGNVLLSISKPASALEIDPEGHVVWRYELDPHLVGAATSAWYRAASVRDETKCRSRGYG